MFVLSLVHAGAIDVKRFTKRNLTEKEQIEAGEHYKKDTGEENILRDFEKLSADSKKENLEAAVGSFNVYKQLSQAGVSIEQMENDNEIKNIIGIAIHTDWLKRNKNHSNESLKVPYSQLDEWTQQQDLTVFSALLKTVKSNLEKYSIQQVPGAVIPNYVEEEAVLLGNSNNEMVADQIIQAMESGTLSIDGQTIMNQENQYNGSTRTMGFCRLSIIAICSFLASCAILVFGILFMN